MKKLIGTVSIIVVVISIIITVVFITSNRKEVPQDRSQEILENIRNSNSTNTIRTYSYINKLEKEIKKIEQRDKFGSSNHLYQYNNEWYVDIDLNNDIPDGYNTTFAFDEIYTFREVKYSDNTSKSYFYDDKEFGLAYDEIYSISLDGNNYTTLVSAESRIVDFYLVGDKILYFVKATLSNAQHYQQDSSIAYICNLDGSNIVKITNDLMSSFEYYEGYIYYLYDVDSKVNPLYKIDLEGSNRMRISDYAGYDFIVAGDWIYYANQYDNGFLYASQVDGGIDVQLSNIPGAEQIYVWGNCIYFRTGKWLYELDTETYETKLLNKNTDGILFVDDETVLLFEIAISENIVEDNIHYYIYRLSKTTGDFELIIDPVIIYDLGRI